MNAATAISTDEPYESRQRARDAEYRDAYAERLESMPAEDLGKLRDLGVAEAHLPRSATAAPGRDLAESSLACCEAVEPFEPGDEDTDADLERTHDLLRRIVGELIGQDNARLSLECLALVTGLVYCGDSMTEIARRHGISRAAVSKRCVALTRTLNLKPSRAMRSLEARANHRRARLKHLDKNQ